MRPFLATLMLIAAGRPLLADVMPIDWPDLIDQSVQSYEDPFLDLSTDQIADLRLFVRLWTTQATPRRPKNS